MANLTLSPPSRPDATTDRFAARDGANQPASSNEAGGFASLLSLLDAIAAPDGSAKATDAVTKAQPAPSLVNQTTLGPAALATNPVTLASVQPEMTAQSGAQPTLPASAGQTSPATAKSASSPKKDGSQLRDTATSATAHPLDPATILSIAQPVQPSTTPSATIADPTAASSAADPVPSAGTPSPHRSADPATRSAGTPAGTAFSVQDQASNDGSEADGTGPMNQPSPKQAGANPTAHPASAATAPKGAPAPSPSPTDASNQAAAAREPMGSARSSSAVATSAGGPSGTATNKPDPATDPTGSTAPAVSASAQFTPVQPSVVPQHAQPAATPAAAAAPQPASPASPAAQAIVEPVKVVLSSPASATAGAPHVTTIQMTPTDLGRVEIRIERDQAGQAKIALVAERPETLSRLVHDQSQLHHALDQAGVAGTGRTLEFSLATSSNTTGGSTPSFTGGNTPNGNGSEGQARTNERSPPRGGFSAIAETGAITTTSSRTLRSGIDITA